MTEPATVCVVDDDESVVKPIAKIVEAIGLRVQTYSTPEDFLDRYLHVGPACLVLDVMMPGMSGVAVQQRLAESGITIPTIVISAHADVRLVVDVMRKGALTFLEKPCRMHELCENIQEAIRLDQESWRRREERENARNCFQQLDPFERQVLERVVAGKTNRFIAQELGISMRTVENRRARIKKKLHVESRTELMALVTSNGIAALFDQPRGEHVTPRTGLIQGR